MTKLDLTNIFKYNEDSLSEEVRLCDGWMDMIYNNETDQLFTEIDEHFIYTEEQFQILLDDIAWEKEHQ